jgi:hypothetical protein
MDETGSKKLKIEYTGGLATHGTRSTFIVATTTGTWHTGVYVIGSNSYACGIVRTASATSLTVEVLYGTFEIGETLTEYDTESAIGSSTAVATLNSKSATSLAEAYPEITLGAEMQIRYMWKNKDGFENAGVSKDGVSTKQANVQSLGMPLQPEVQTMLLKYRRISV